MMNKKTIVIVAGPTAVGKTGITIDLAKELNGEIISADSMQIYKHFDIGSAKPTKEEIGDVKHYLIDEIDPNDTFSVSDYREQAQKYIDEIIAKGKVPIITGGTGLYLNALMYNMDFSEAVKNEDLRKKLEIVAEEQGAEALYNQLKELDPSSAKRIHVNNVRKVIRALEVIMTTGKGINDFSTGPEENDEYNIILIGLTRNRKKLYARINKRVELMVDAGLLEEVKNLKEMGLSDDCQAMRGIGYKEVVPYLNGLYSKEQMISLIKQNSRRYAKRQMTWLRRYKNLKWFDYEDYNDYNGIKREIISYIKERL